MELLRLVAPSEKMSSSMRKTCEFTSSAMSHPSLCSPLIHSIVSSDSGRGQRNLIWAFVIRAYPEGAFSLG